MFGLLINIDLQRKLIKRHCFGDCGKIIIGGGFDNELGEIALCRENNCKHSNKQMNEPIGKINNEQIYLRKLK